MPEIRLINPARKSKGSRKARKVSRRGSSTRRRKTNPGPGVLISMANPKRKSKSKKAARSRRKNPSVRVITRYKNGAGKGTKRRKRNGVHRHRNPLSIGGFNIKQLVEGGVGAAGGAIAARALTEKFFSKWNEGISGYALNLGVAAGLSYACFRFLKLPTFATGVAFGGVGATMQRVYSENVSKLIPAAILTATGGEQSGKGMGDAEYSGAGMYVLNGYYGTSGGEQLQLGSRYGAAAPPPAHAALPSRGMALHMAGVA